jgi:dTDP-4-dehydrorhamnose reductase
MLGRAWLRHLASLGVPHRGLTRAICDVLDPRAVREHVKGGLVAVINCTAWTDVDGAEKDEAAARRVNGEAVRTLVKRCDEAGVPLVHYSTDYVFDGAGTRPYQVDQPTSPINAYGRSKLEGEKHVLASRRPHLLIRTSWVYAPWGRNFVLTIANAAKAKPSLRVVNDQRGRPTSAEHLAAATWNLMTREQRGVFHVTDGGECTWFDLATEVARHVAPSCVVEPCTTAEFPRPARRPGYSVLDLSRTEAILGPMPDWRESLAHVLANGG